MKDLFIRKWQVDDAAPLAMNANNRKVWINLTDGFPYPYTYDDARSFISMASTGNTKIDFQAILWKGDAVGGIGISLQEDVHRINAMIGYWLGQAYWGKGIMTEAVKYFTDYTFQTYPQIQRIYAPIFSYNKGSMRVLEKVGYSEEAILKNALIKDYKIIDEHIYSLLRDSWKTE